MAHFNDTVTIERETDNGDVAYELDVTGETYRAEPSVGIMTDGIDWLAATYHGTAFALTDSEVDYISQLLRDRGAL